MIRVYIAMPYGDHNSLEQRQQEGIRPRAPAQNGITHRQETYEERSGSPQERKRVRQSYLQSCVVCIASRAQSTRHQTKKAR